MVAQSPKLTPEILVPRLGDYLVEKSVISQENLEHALAYQQNLRLTQRIVPIGNILMEMGLIDRPTLEEAITEQIIRLRAALENANRSLEQRVKERTSELEMALQRLSELSSLKSNFIANVSHELRTPLTHLRGYLDLFTNGDLGAVNEEQTHALQVIGRSTEKLERLIEDLILFSQSERGRVTLRSALFDICPTCQTSLNQSIAKASEHKVNLTLDIPAGPLVVNADQEKITWVLMQLLDNAIKFTPEEGIITLKIENLGKFLKISVIDTGIGIPLERIPEIFEPFHQLDGSSTRQFGGTGLGLTMVKQIVEAHGSIVNVTSVVNQGTQLDFILKLAQ
jgi:two-component system sensor histidine kinase/response regulator